MRRTPWYGRILPWRHEERGCYTLRYAGQEYALVLLRQAAAIESDTAPGWHLMLPDASGTPVLGPWLASTVEEARPVGEAWILAAAADLSDGPHSILPAMIAWYGAWQGTVGDLAIIPAPDAGRLLVHAPGTNGLAWVEPTRRGPLLAYLTPTWTIPDDVSVDPVTTRWQAALPNGTELVSYPTVTDALLGLDGAIDIHTLRIRPEAVTAAEEPRC